jgi:sugar O-acyltransferase (sialic acid O-acetyltransferase NeuD family)
MKRLAIIGSGDLGQLIAYYASADNHYNVAGFFDDYKQKGDVVNNIPVLGTIESLFEAYSNNLFDCIIIAVGYKHFTFRKNIYAEINGCIPLGTIIHSNSFVARSCSIGAGVVILPGCIIDNEVTIKDNVFLNIAVSIAHGCTIKAHSFLSPRVAISGAVVIGECCNIGINTTIIDNICITDHVQTGGGAVVIDNIDQSGLYVGIPAKMIKKKTSGAVKTMPE